MSSLTLNYIKSSKIKDISFVLKSTLLTHLLFHNLLLYCVSPNYSEEQQWDSQYDTRYYGEDGKHQDINEEHDEAAEAENDGFDDDE